MEKIVIIGGGFAGLQLARKLNKKDKDVVVIDKVNHHMFQPLFYQLACGRIDPSNISFPFRKMFQHSPNTQFRMAEVDEIVPETNKVVAGKYEFIYDKLIIATGCKTNYFGNDNIAGNAYSMKSTEEAINIRNKILLKFEELIIKKQNSDEGDWNIVIVGSGPTGVELSGAFAEMKTNIIPRDYPKMNFEKLKVTLVSASSTTLETMSTEAQEASLKYLKQLGVNILLDKIVTDYDGSTLTFKDGEKIPTKNVIWAAGVTGNIIKGLNPDIVIRNRYKVNRFNKVEGYDNIYAIGDIAYMETPKYPHAHPQVANVAINQGINLAKNLCQSDTSKWIEYEYKDLGSMATIGKYRAVVDLGKIKFQGFFAWYMWMLLHLMLILSVRSKLAIFFNWMWNYINKDSSLRIITIPIKEKEQKQDNK